MKFLYLILSSIILISTVYSQLISIPASSRHDFEVPDSLLHTSNYECTSFCLPQNGSAVFGSNYDYPKDNPEGLVFVNKRNVSKTFAESDSLSRHVQWTSKYGSVSVNLVTGQASFAGMNEAGLVISLMGLRGSIAPPPDSRPWIHSYLVLQYILDNFATIPEVIAGMSTLRPVGTEPPYWIPHYLVSDQKGKCATIEFLDGKLVVHTGEDLPVKALANSTYEKSISIWRRNLTQKNEINIASIKDPSIRRFLLAAKRVTSYTPESEQSAVHTAFDILDEVSGQNIKGSPTLWSLVFGTKSMRVYFKTILNPEIRFIDLQKLEFSCQTPVRMLDINEKLSGDITGKLTDYSFKLHLAHALKARIKWEMKINPTELERVIKMYDGFLCK